MRSDGKIGYYDSGLRPPAVLCAGVWYLLTFLMGFLTCLVFSPSRSTMPSSSPAPGLFQDISPVSTPLPQHVYRAGDAKPINHPGASGEVSQVLKRQIFTGKESGLPGLVHLSLVDFGDGGKDEGREALGFPPHVHGTGFHEVFLVLTGSGTMELDGIPTGVLTTGSAVHVPPGVTHHGQAMPLDDGSHFVLAYFAILDKKVG